MTTEGEPENYSTLSDEKRMLERLRNAAEVIAFMDARTISPGHNADAFGKGGGIQSYLEFLANCNSIEELWNEHSHKMAEYGFDLLLYGFTRYRNGKSLGDPEDFVILTNYPKPYVEVFLEDGQYLNNPMMKWALNNEGVASWSILGEMIRKQGLTPVEKRAVALNRKMGVTAGYTISFKSASERSKGAIALSAREGMTQAEVDEIWAKHGRDIHLMNNVAHLKMLTLPYGNPERLLTQRQREALEWVGDGKTVQDIALLMGLTSATVEKHLRLAREALEVETTSQAVLKSAFAKQMFISEG